MRQSAPGESESREETIAIIWQEMMMAFPGGLDARHKSWNGIGDDVMVWGLSKKNGGYFLREETASG